MRPRSRNEAPRPLSSPIATQHVRELASRKSKVYELLLALDSNAGADEPCFESLARIVDRVLFYEISLDSAALRDLCAFVAATDGGLDSALAALAAALSDVEPDRGSVRLLLARFPNWLNSAPALTRPFFLAILPKIAPHLNELGNSGVESLIACLNECSSTEDAEHIAQCVFRYQETSGDIIAAAAQLAGLFMRTGDRPCIEGLATAVPTEVMLDSKDARALLPAMVKLKTASSGDAVWAAAVRVCIEAARHNHSSALYLAQHLAQTVAMLKPAAQLAYLDSFSLIIREAGISLVGYGTKQLPVLFEKAGADRAGQFVAEGVAVARKYGKIAAEEFFEQRTPASKQASPLR
jgi:hypothetical protein